MVDSYQRKTRLIDAVQTSIGQLNDISVAIGVIDFQLMRFVVEEKIIHLIKHTANQKLSLTIMCASGEAHMQEGILSLMQMSRFNSLFIHYHYYIF